MRERGRKSMKERERERREVVEERIDRGRKKREGRNNGVG